MRHASRPADATLRTKADAANLAVATDAMSLRALLSDKVPGVRALAAESLATLHQPEDVSRLAALLTDGAEATMELQAPFVGQQVPPFPVGPQPDAGTGHTCAAAASPAMPHGDCT